MIDVVVQKKEKEEAKKEKQEWIAEVSKKH
jgi:hypothetical protein